MKKTSITFLLSCLLFAFTYSQNQLVVEDNVASGPERALIVEHNMDSGSNGLTALSLMSGTGQNLSSASIVNYNANYTAIPDYAGYLTLLSGSNSTAGRGINLVAQRSGANIRFYLGGIQASDIGMVLESNGNLGVGESNPRTKVHVTNGDIYIDDTTSGIIMKSPNNNCWRVTIDNTGAMVSTPLISCP